MIRINLAKRKTSAAVAGSSDTALSRFTRVEVGNLRQLPLLQVGLALLGIYGSGYFFDERRVADLAEVDQQITQLKTAQTQLQAKLAKNSAYEELKKSLEADEKLVRVKLDTIMKLMEDKTAAVSTLRRLSGSIPQEVWLSSFQFNATDVQFSGSAIDNGQVLEFMKQLGQTETFTDINLDSSTQSKDERGMVLASFKLSGKRK